MIPNPDLGQIEWRDESGARISCIEKLRVLTETLGELQQAAQDALEDAILMGCAESQVRDVLRGMIAGLTNPYSKS
jgi:hypothetical protein